MDIRLIDLAQASDDQLSDALPRLDGAWSRQTRALLAKFKTDRLDLNGNWAGEGPLWMCPCCKRSKPDIARRSEAGVLLCHLELHHDHLRDFGKRALRERNPLPEDEAERVELMSAFRACKSLLERFYNTLICKDCNRAEGIAKAALEDAPRDFSFSPAEIARFITARPHEQHQVDLDAAKAIWETLREDVADRLAFVQLLAERIAQGRHRRQGRPPSLDYARRPSELLLALASGISPADLYGLPGRLAERSERRQGFSARRAVRRGAIVAPTSAEWAALDAAQPRTSGWRRAPENWVCPVCERDRRTIPRRSKTNKWTGKLHAHVVLLTETDWTSLGWRGVWDEGDITFGDHEDIWLCQDCRQVITDVKTQDPKLSDYCLSVEDLRQLVTEVEPHARPIVDLDAALDRARGNALIEEAAFDYVRHRSRCLSRRARYDLIRQAWSLSHDEALGWLLLRLDEEGETSFELDRLEWELEEGARFKGRNEAQDTSEAPTTA